MSTFGREKDAEAERLIIQHNSLVEQLKAAHQRELESTVAQARQRIKELETELDEMRTGMQLAEENHRFSLDEARGQIQAAVLQAHQQVEQHREALACLEADHARKVEELRKQVRQQPVTSKQQTIKPLTSSGKEKTPVRKRVSGVETHKCDSCLRSNLPITELVRIDSGHMLCSACMRELRG
jgi:hypothetical protein